MSTTPNPLDPVKASVAQLTSDVNDAFTAIDAHNTAQKQQIADLQAQVAAGSPVTPADLQALLDSVNGIDAIVKAFPATQARMGRSNNPNDPNYPRNR